MNLLLIPWRNKYLTIVKPLLILYTQTNLPYLQHPSLAALTPPRTRTHGQFCLTTSGTHTAPLLASLHHRVSLPTSNLYFARSSRSTTSSARRWHDLVSLRPPTKTGYLKRERGMADYDSRPRGGRPGGGYNSRKRRYRGMRSPSSQSLSFARSSFCLFLPL